MSMKNALILLLAGSGSRLYSSIQVKKQFYPIQGKELFLYPLESFVMSSHFQEIVLVVDEEDEKKVDSIVKKRFPSLSFTLVKGGKDRNESVYHGLLSLKGKEVDKVFIHDSARALISEKEISDLVQASLQFDALTLVVPVSDSLLREEDGKIRYIDRKNAYRILTPQVFSFPKILDLYEQGYDSLDTDDFSKAIKNHWSYFLVRGDVRTFKVTQEDDLRLLESVLMK